MGLYRRLFKGASRDDVAPRSPEDARAALELSEELRDLKDEIRKLREALQDSPQSPRRGDVRSRGGRSRSSGGSRTRGGSFSERGRLEGPAKVPPDDAPTGPLVDYLKKHKVTVFEGQDDLARNEAFEHLARHLGQHFSLLAVFYEKMKRAVATGRTTRVDIDSYTEAERSAAVQLGTLLYRHGMLKDFYYHRSPRKQLRVIPTKDGETQQFLTGGWLEIYVVWLLSKRLKGHLQPNQYQVLFNVKGTLPTGNEFEADYMACVNGRLLWLECKTGQWQDYSARFRGLVKVFGSDRTGAGLVLIKSPDTSTRSRATDMLDMTLLSLDDVESYVDEFLDVPAADRLPKMHRVPASALIPERSEGNRRPARSSAASGGSDDEGRGGRNSRSSSNRGSAAASSGSAAPARRKPDPTSPEDATPLKDPEPAKRLGKVNLEEGSAIPRRRRRRRSTRDRPEEGGAASKSESLRAELPVKPLTAEEKAAESKAVDSKASARAKPVIPEGMVAPRPNWPEVTEDKAAKDVEVKADREAKELEEQKETPAPRAKRPRRRRRATRPGEVGEGGDAAADAKGDDSAKAEVAKEPSSSEPTSAPTPSAEAKSADSAPAEGGEEAKPVRKRRATKKAKSTRKRASTKPAADADADAKIEPAAAAVTGEKAAADSTKAPAEKEEVAKREPKPRAKRASRRKTEAKPKSDEVPVAQPELKLEPEAKPKAEPRAKPEAKAEPKPKEQAEAKPAPKPRAESKRKSASGVTITPDLSAMMAGSKAPKKDKPESKE
jgi:hypothetical protein